MSVLEKSHNGAVSGKKEKCHKGASCLFWRKVIMVLIWNSKSTIVTFLPEQSWRCFLHHYDFSHFLGPKLQRQFLGWKNALIPQLIDSDGRALHKDSESGHHSKITKITNMTFLQYPAEWVLPVWEIFRRNKSVKPNFHCKWRESKEVRIKYRTKYSFALFQTPPGVAGMNGPWSYLLALNFLLNPRDKTELENFS